MTIGEMDTVRRLVRFEVRVAIRDLYLRMGYDEAVAVGAWQQEHAPRALDINWVHEPTK